ncbi:hypothetical protein [Gorillibacterium timonense]|uniref:hypothetical protein n=1 Tax=Gorillibacterium timonense TaxID=1689269 RepID=UPI00071C6662|nr:hypothetical protein [Gorillibacterium timonense]
MNPYANMPMVSPYENAPMVSPYASNMPIMPVAAAAYNPCTAVAPARSGMDYVLVLFILLVIILRIPIC